MDSRSAKRNPKEFDFDSERAKYLVIDILQAHLQKEYLKLNLFRVKKSKLKKQDLKLECKEKK